MANTETIDTELRTKSKGVVKHISRGDFVDKDDYVINHVLAPFSAKVYEEKSGSVTLLDQRRTDGDRAIYEGRVLLIDLQGHYFELRSWRNSTSGKAEQTRAPLSAAEFKQRIASVEDKPVASKESIPIDQPTKAPQATVSAASDLSGLEKRFQIAQEYKDRLLSTRSGVMLVSRTMLAGEFDQARIKGKNSKDIESILSATGIKVIPFLHNGPNHVLLTLKEKGMYKDHPELFGDDPYEAVQNALEFALEGASGQVE